MIFKTFTRLFPTMRMGEKALCPFFQLTCLTNGIHEYACLDKKMEGLWLYPTNRSSQFVYTMIAGVNFVCSFPNPIHLWGCEVIVVSYNLGQKCCNIPPQNQCCNTAPHKINVSRIRTCQHWIREKGVVFRGACRILKRGVKL